jgi:hypothetical protein
MAEQKPKTVTVEATEYHTHDGREYQVGDIYELPEHLVESVTGQRKVKVVEPGTASKKAPAKAAKLAPKTASKKKGRK